MSRHKWWYATSFFLDFLKFINDAAVYVPVLHNVVHDHCEVQLGPHFPQEAVLEAGRSDSAQLGELKFNLIELKFYFIVSLKN